MAGGECGAARRVLFKNLRRARYLDAQREQREGLFLLAGGSQGGSVWVRDACFSTPGLLLRRNADGLQAVTDLITMYFACLDAEATPIKVFDSVPSELRYICAALPRAWAPDLGAGPLRPFAADWRGALAYDSHLLILYSLSYLPLAAQTALLAANEGAVRRMLAWYPERMGVLRARGKPVRADLLWQEPFSTWTDSLDEEGHFFFLNLLLLEVQLRLCDGTRFRDAIPRAALAEALRGFKLPKHGVFRTCLEMPDNIALDGNLFALLWHKNKGAGRLLADDNEARRLWAALNASPLGRGAVSPQDASRADCCDFGRHPGAEPTGKMGFASWPDPPRVAWPVALACVTTYHGGMYWSWLVGLSRQVARLYGPAGFSAPEVADMVRVGPGKGLEGSRVYEVTRHRKSFAPYQTCLYSAEDKFSWGAAFIYACETQNGAILPWL